MVVPALDVEEHKLLAVQLLFLNLVLRELNMQVDMPERCRQETNRVKAVAAAEAFTVAAARVTMAVVVVALATYLS